MASNRRTGPGELIIETMNDVRVNSTSRWHHISHIVFHVFQFYFHAPEDVPFINSDSDQRADVILGETYNITLKVRKTLDVTIGNCYS